MKAAAGTEWMYVAMFNVSTLQDAFDPFYDLLVEQQNATDTLQDKIDAMQNSLNTMTYIAVAALVVAVVLGAVATYLPRKRK